MDKKVLDLPYAERQIIIVEDDVVVDAKRKADIENEKNKSVEYSKLFVEILLKMSPVQFVLVDGIKYLIKSVYDLRKQGINILTISRTESQEILFPPGHPRNNVVYIGHPASQNVYYTVAEFHRKTFEHKFSEAIRLLMSLGAKKINVEYLSGWSNDFASKISVGVGKITESKTEAKVEKEKNTRLLFKANLPNNKSCCLPKNLLWYYHEPSWQQIGEGRLEYGMSDFSLLVHYEDDYGINVGLKVNAQKAGLDLGGSFEEHISTVWEITGEF